MNVIQTTLKSLQIGAFATLLFASSCKKDKINSDPTITSFTPESGAVGTEVTITGTNFSTTATDNTVQFNGTAATVTAATATSITTSVPTAATTGKITVAVSGKTATSATDFTVGTTGTTGTFDAFSYTNKSVVLGKKDSSIAPTATRTTTSALTYTITDIKFNDVSLATSSYAIIPGTGTNAGTSTVALNANVTTGTLVYPAYKTNIFKLKADGSVVISSWCAQGVYKLYVTASDGTNTKAAILTATITAPAGTITAVTYAAGTSGGNYATSTKTITVTNGSNAWVTYATATATKTGTFTPYYWIDKVTKDGTELYADVEDKRNALGVAHKIWLDGTSGAIGLDGSATIGKYVLSVRAGDGGNSIAVGDITVDLQSFAPYPTSVSYSSSSVSVPSNEKHLSVAATIPSGTSGIYKLKSITKEGVVVAITDLWAQFGLWFDGDGKIYWGGNGSVPTGTYVLTISANAAGTVTTTYTITVGTASSIAYSPNNYTYGVSSNWATESVAPTVVGKTGTAGTNYYIYIKSIKKDSETAVTGGPSDFSDTYKISAGNAAGADYGKLYWKYETPAGVYTITVEMTGGVTTTYTLTKP